MCAQGSPRSAWTARLREACRLSGAAWAAWIYRREGVWTLGVHYGLTAARRKALQALLQRPAWHRWLAGALSSGRVRSRRVGRATALGDRVTAFPHEGGLLLVGAALSKEHRAWWRLLLTAAPPHDRPEMALDPGRLYRAMMAPLHRGPFELAQAVQEVLRVLAATCPPCQAGYFAVREGSAFRLLAAQSVKVGKTQCEADEVPEALRRALAEGRLLVTHRDVLGMARTQHGTRCWANIPVSLGRRWLGVLAFYHPAGFSQQEIHPLTTLGDLLAPGLEVLLTFDEVTRLLRRAALVNEVALTLARSPDARTAIRRLLRHLRTIFRTERVVVVVPQDEATFVSIDLETEEALPVEGSLSGWVFRTGQVARYGDVREAPEYYVVWEDTRSQLSVPMRLGKRVIGVVTLESERPHAFSEDDEKLLQVLANHLALFIEVGRLTEALGERLRWLNAVHGVMVHLSGVVAEDELARLAAQELAERLAYDGVVVALWEGEELVVRGVGGLLSEWLPVGTRLRGAEAAWLRGQSSRGGAQQPADGRLPRWVPWREGHQARFPLQGNGEDLGVLWVVRHRARPFEGEETHVLETLAQALSGMLTSARRYAQLQRYASHLDVARKTALDIGANLEMDVLLRRVVARVKNLLQAKGAELGLLNAEQGVVEVVVSENPWRDYTGMVIPLMQGVAGRAAATGETVWVEDYNRWPEREPSTYQAPFRAVLSVPLKFEQEVVGVLTVYDDRLGRAFLPEEVQLLEILAPQVALAIRNARLYAELEQRMRQQAEAEARLLQSARLAAIGEMAAGVAHELNNPLTTVSGFVELVLEDLPQDAPWRADLELVLKEARRAQGIVRRLLAFAHPSDTGKVPTQINALVEETIELLRNVMRTQGVQLALDLAPHLPLVEVAPGPLKQVFLNLMNNALQAMPQGGRLHIVSGTETRQGQPGVFVRFQDTGKGIPEEVLPRIFEPFFTTKPPGQGTGLGLAISYSVVRKHGGELTVESRVGEGSAFTVWLPLS